MSSTAPAGQGVTVNTTEDWRGVDVTQIRRQLSMTPAERLRHMTHVANVMMQMRRTARSGH